MTLYEVGEMSSRKWIDRSGIFENLTNVENIFHLIDCGGVPMASTDLATVRRQLAAPLRGVLFFP